MRARAFVLLLAIATHAAAAPLDEMQKSFTALVNAGDSEAAFRQGERGGSRRGTLVWRAGA